MIKDITYSGLSANGSPYTSPDGSLSLAFNCINEDGALSPILEPYELFHLDSPTMSCLYAHTVNSVRHFILLEANSTYGGAFQLLYLEEGQTVFCHFNGTPQFKEVYSVNSIGNVLTVISDIGISYFLWTGSGYDYIGEHMPELDLSFSLNPYNNFYSDVFSVEPDGGISQNETAANPGYAEQWQMVRTAMHAAANSLVAKISKEHYFTFPFFIRYAYRLFDGSVTMQSAPILLVPSFDCISVDMGWVDRVSGSDKPFYAKAAKVKASAGVYSIVCNIISSGYQLRNWKNIISSVDFFISPQFYTYDSNADISVPDAISGRLPRRNVAPDIVGNSNFYLIKSISIDELLSTYSSQSSFEIKPDFSVNNDNIVVRESLPDDYNSHNTLYPRLQHVFNSRLNIAAINERFYRGYSPASLYSTNLQYKVVEASYNVHIQSNQGEWTLTPTLSKNLLVDDYNNILWFFYPNIRAKYVVFHIKRNDDNGDVVYDEYQKYYLKPHTLLNGSYFFLFDNTAESTKASRPAPTEILSRSVEDSVFEVTDAPSVSEDESLVQPNSIYTSEVNNPFAFPLLGINSIGSGEIIGITSATKALSQGQFGQFPLYAFCSDGVWALEPSSDGSFTTKQAVSRDVCTSPASITQLDSSVAFATARGLMLLQGSQCECLSNILGTERSFFAYDLGEDSFNKLINEAGYDLASDEINIIPFPEYAANCQLVYDYIHQRIIIFNTRTFYCYVYSLKSKLWGMFYAADIKHRINSYTDALVMKGKKVVDLSKPGNNGQQILVVTNPINLDSPDILKTIRTIAQRGYFKRENIQQILYGSRDLFHWHAISSSTSEFLRGWRGTPYKYFRIAFTAYLKRGESVSGCQVLYEQRYTNRIR